MKKIPGVKSAEADRIRRAEQLYRKALEQAAASNTPVAEDVRYALDDADEIPPGVREILRKRDEREALRKNGPASVELYSEEEYNRFGWARVNNIISARTNQEFQRHLNMESFVKGRTADDFLIVETGREYGVGNTVIVTDGRQNSPSIERVYQIDYDSDDDAERIRRDLYDAEKKYGGAALYFVGNDYGLVSGFERGSMPTYADLSAQGRRVGLRGLRGETGEGDPELPDGGGGGRSDTRYALGGVTLPSPEILDSEMAEFHEHMAIPPPSRP